MGDADPDEHLRIFKCLIDTGSDVLRNAMETKLLVNNTITFEQYLVNHKHQFYHQYEKNKNNPCCIRNMHGCNVNGNMDKNIFTKLYNKMAEQDTKLCLDRYEIKLDICVDNLDLSDINFFLWNSKTLSNSEKSSLQAIMKTRSDICHTSSTQKYSITELENIWIPLEKDVLLFAEPHRYKTSIKREISLLRNNKLNMTDTAKITDVMRTEIDKILKESQATNESIENQLKDGLVEFKNLLVDERSTSKINDKLHELMETNKNNCKRFLRSTEEMKDELREDSMNTKNHSERQFKSFETTLKENKENHHQTLKKCSEGIETTVKQEGINTRNHNKDEIHAIGTKLTECQKSVCQAVSRSQGLTEDKIREEANETRKQNEGLHSDLIEKNRLLTDTVINMANDMNEMKTMMIGMIGKQTVELEMNCEQIEQLVTTTETREMNVTGRVCQSCLTSDKEKQVIENIPSEIEVPIERPSGGTRKDTITVIAKKVNSIILEMKFTPGILESVKTFKLAILTIVKNMQIAGEIDTCIEDTVTVNLKFESPLTLDQIAVLKGLFTKEKDSDSDDVQLPTEYSNEFSMEGAFINLQSQEITTPIRIPESCTLVSTTDDTSTSPHDSDSSVLLKDFDSASSSGIEYIDNTNSFPYKVISDAVLSESIQLSTKPPSASSEIMENTIKALENMTQNCDILEVYKMRETHERNFPKEQLTWTPCTSCALKDQEIKDSEEIFQEYQHKEWNQMLGIHCMLCVIKDKTLQELEKVSQQHLRLIEMYKADGIETTFFLWEHFKRRPCKICEIKNMEIEAYSNIFREYSRYKWRGHQEGTLLQGEITKTHCFLCEIKNKQIKVFEKRILQYAQILEIYELHGIQEGTFLWDKINRNPCNLCELKDEQIRKLEKETEEHKQSMEIFKLRDAMLKTPRYNCRNCYEKDQMIIYLDKRLHETRQRVEQEKQISETSLLDDLMKLTSIDKTMDSVDEKTELKESELGSNVSSLKSGIISKSKMEEVQPKDVQWTAPCQKQKMSNQSNQILELRYAYAANSYTKEEGQKGLAIIISKDIRNLISQLVDKRISHSRDFFGEMGFQVEYFKDGYFQDFLFNIKHGNFYCVFVMVIGFQEFNFWAMYSSLAKRFRGKPKIIMVDSAKPQYPFGNIVEEPDTLFISMHEQFIASYGQLKEFNVIDNFIAVTQCSRFTDIMEILTRINALYDRPVISFHSSFRKKFYFL